MPRFVMTLPHGLSRADAKQRVNQGLSMLASYVGKHGGVGTHWSGDTVQVEIRAFGQSAAGLVEVGDGDVRIDGKVPLLLAPFTGKIRDLISSNAGTLLNAPTTGVLPGRSPQRKRKGPSGSKSRWF